MGKRLIIKGADFSANAVDGIFTDITGMFNSWSAGTYSANNGNSGSSSTVFKKNAKVDVSAYAGKEIRFTKVNYTTSSLNESLYGLAFYNSSNTFISGIKFPKNENVAGSAATYFAIGTVPQGTKYIGVTYLNDAKIEEIDGLPFKIEVAV